MAKHQPSNQGPASPGNREESIRLAHEALAAPTPRKAKQLAEKALQADATCPEAMCALAQVVENPMEEEYYWRRAILIWEAELADVLTPSQTHLWENEEGQAYLQAKEGLADLYTNIGRRGAAVELYQEILRQNQEDHQGVRYSLMAELTADWRDREARELLERYEEDEFCVWTYARVLLEFRALVKRHPWNASGALNEPGGGPGIRDPEMKVPAVFDQLTPILEGALQSNPYVGFYLLFPYLLPEEEEFELTEGMEDDEEVEAKINGPAILDPWWTFPEILVWSMPLVVSWLSENGYEDLLENVPPPPDDWDDDEDLGDEDDEDDRGAGRN